MATIKLTGVDEDLYRRLSTKAREEGVSLEEFVRGQLQRTAARPTEAEIEGLLARPLER